MNVKYKNFDLEVYEYQEQDGRETFSVRVTNSPAGDQSPSQAEAIALPGEFRQRSRDIKEGFDNKERIIEYGSALADCLLPFSVRQLMLASVRLLKEDEALRLRLKFDAWQVADLPWELCYVSRSSTRATSKEIDGFLALDRRISITRYEYTDYPPYTFDQGEDTLIRQLVLLASPPDLPRLELDDEARVISESLQGITNLSIDFLADATLDHLQDALEKPAHIFHFAGHGGFLSAFGKKPGGDDEGTGVIILCGTDGKYFQFPADKLALNLSRCGVRVAFINTNYSAARDTHHRLSGVASALAYAGIPAVIGYSGPVSDKGSILFARAFYRALASGSSIDTAVMNGRLAMFNTPVHSEFEWASPVLYLRADENTLFPIRPKAQKTAEQKTAAVNKLALRDMLVAYFNKEELDGLCFEVNGLLSQDGIQQRVDLDMVGGDTLASMALNLIQHLERRDLLHYLTRAVASQRPNLLPKVQP